MHGFGKSRRSALRWMSITLRFGAKQLLAWVLAWLMATGNLLPSDAAIARVRINSAPSAGVMTTPSAPMPSPQSQAPVANAGNNQTVAAGSTVTLSGSASNLPAGAGANFQWSFVSMPSGSTATLSNATASNVIVSNATFVADKVGTYQVQLVVSDSSGTSAPSMVTITAQIQPPTANAGPNQTVALSSTAGWITLH